MWKNKTAIITGASGGIGRAISRKTGGYGMNLILTGRNPETLEETGRLVREEHPDVRYRIVPGDLTDLGFLDILLQKTEEEFGGLDVLVNNAGLAHHCTVEEMTPGLFDAIMATNVRAPYFLMQKSLPMLRASGCGTIINICSVVAHKGYPMQSAYAASKHALLGLSKSFANEIYKDNVRVHTISPGGVFTDMVAIARPDLTAEGMILPEDIARIAGFYLENRASNAVIDEIEVHRSNKEPFA